MLQTQTGGVLFCASAASASEDEPNDIVPASCIGNVQAQFVSVTGLMPVVGQGAAVTEFIREKKYRAAIKKNRLAKN